MQRRFRSDTWSLTVPEEWSARNDEPVATLHNIDPIGVLQISAAFKDTKVLEADLRGFASEHIAAGVKTRPCTAGDFVGFEIAFGDEESFWRQWYLRNGRQMLFVTYNCGADYRGIEDEIVRSSLCSLIAYDADL